MTDTPYITAASVTFVQDGNTMGTTANPEILIIEAEVQPGADGPFYVLRTNTGWSFDKVEELDSLVEIASRLFKEG